MFNEDERQSVGRDRSRGRRGAGPHRDHGDAGGHFRGGPRGRGGQRQKRGDVRAAVLVLLEEQPRNGYQLIQELTERSNESWRPSPGSIYPVLQQLEDEGLVRGSVEGTGRTYDLTNAGRTLVNEQREQLGKPWELGESSFRESAREIMGSAKDVMMAARQVVVAGSDAQTARANAILVEARRALYAVLGEGD